MSSWRLTRRRASCTRICSSWVSHLVSSCEIGESFLTPLKSEERECQSSDSYHVIGKGIDEGLKVANGRLVVLQVEGDRAQVEHGGIVPRFQA